MIKNKKYQLIVILIIVLLITSILVLYNFKNNYNKNNSTNNNTIIKLSSYNNPIIPDGFKKIETDSASWQLDENDNPKGWNNGLVIEDSIGNQFVWIPVDINNLKYLNYYKENYKVYDLNNLDTNIIEEHQILTYGGFYVARYEAGVTDEMNKILTNISSLTNDVTGIPVSKKNVRVWDFISLKNAKLNATSMYNTTTLNSDLITEKQWLTIIQWLQNNGYKFDGDSSNYGNYSNVNFKFTGLYSIDYGKNYQYGDNILKNTYNMILSSGATERNMTNNIYDLAGNVLEYTDEYTTNGGGGYYCAGGHFDNTGTSYAIDNIALINTKPLEKVGFRVVLYMK